MPPLQRAQAERAAPHWGAGPAALVAAAYILTAVDLLAGITAEFPPILLLSWLEYGLGALGVGLAVLLYLGLPVLGIVALAQRHAPDAVGRRLPILLAALFGLSWQWTLVQGDGIRAHVAYRWIQIAFAIVGPAGVGALTWWLLSPRLGAARTKRTVAGVALVTGCLFNVTTLRDYRAFHGHLALFDAALLCYLLWPHVQTRRAAWLASLGAVAAAVGIVAGPSPWAFVEGHVLRLTAISGPLAAVAPLSDRVLSPPSHPIDPGAPVDASRVPAIERLQREAVVEASEPKGRNVILVVLETARADHWAHPAVTPHFHALRKHGTYFPAGLAQYPSTLLAYGAMFTAQTPSVLLATSNWVDEPLFGRIRGRFDHMVLTKPTSRWFDRSTITDFFARGESAARHGTAAEAFAYLQKNLEAIPPAESFFAWAHIYEPHYPYENHDGFPQGEGEHAKYRAEIAYVDEQLGKFIEWHHARPAADDTLLIVVSDHGEGLGENIHGEIIWLHSNHVVRELVDIPIYLSGRGIPEGEVGASVEVGQIDLMPTIFEFLGAELPASFHTQGVPIQRLLRAPRPRTLISEQVNMQTLHFFERVERLGEASRSAIRAGFRELNHDPRFGSRLAVHRGRWRLVCDRVLHHCWLHDRGDRHPVRRDFAASAPDAMKAMQRHLDDWLQRQRWVIQHLDDAYLKD